MKISSIGEQGIIDLISYRVAKDAARNSDAIGIGDDCAVIPFGETKNQLISTDLLIEGVHFLKDKISAFDLGHKSLAVNLSDIAAMGGTPQSAFLSLAISGETEVSWLKEFMEGFSRLAEEHETRLLGGDTTRTPGPLVINVTIVGAVEKNQTKLRSTAQAGDIICVTGNLGDSGAGLKALLENVKKDLEIEFLIQQHHRPRPHLKEGQWLAQFKEVHAMMDVSDGIDSDLNKISKLSRLGAKVFLDKLPISENLENVCSRQSWNKFDLSAAAGEDYCLLTTVDPRAYDLLAEKFRREFNSKLHKIGEMTSVGNGVAYFLNEKPTAFQPKGFSHF